MRIDDDRLLRRFARRRDAGDLEALVLRYRPMARSLARRYTRTGLQLEDLEQVACVGLIKALQRFDPSRGTAFATFAVPTVLGEIRRYCRDTLWPVHVPRTVQERIAAVRRAGDAITTARGRPPTVAELRAAIDLDEEEIIEALQATALRTPVPLDAGARGDGEDAAADPADWLGGEDPGYAYVEDVACVAAAVSALTDREREAVHLRFAEELNQQEIARRMGVPEGRIGALLATALGRLRDVANVPRERELAAVA